jgi:hypothetical protein
MKLLSLVPALAVGTALLANAAPASAQNYYHHGYYHHRGYYGHPAYYGHYRYWHGHRAMYRNGAWGYWAPHNGVNVWISVPL